MQFRFFRANELIPSNYLEDGRVSVEDILNHNDPFNCECRAYGRLKEVGRQDLAVQCYGYLMLSKDLEARLTTLSFHDWKRDKAFKNRPLRCIVKELLPIDASPSSYELLPRMREDLLDLHAYGIVVWDLHSGNYLQGQIIDFSQAKTVPHIELCWDSDIFPRKRAVDHCARDYSGFDGVIADWNDAHPERTYWHRFLPSSSFGRRLRDRSRYRVPMALREGVRLDAIFYDWKNKQPCRAKIGNLAYIYQQQEQTGIGFAKPYEITAARKRVKTAEERKTNRRKRVSKKQ